MKLSHMGVSQGCAQLDAPRNWLIYRCFRVAKTSKKARIGLRCVHKLLYSNAI